MRRVASKTVSFSEIVPHATASLFARSGWVLDLDKVNT